MSVPASSVLRCLEDAACVLDVHVAALEVPVMEPTSPGKDAAGQVGGDNGNVPRRQVAHPAHPLVSILAVLWSQRRLRVLSACPNTLSAIILRALQHLRAAPPWKSVEKTGTSRVL